MMYFKSQIDLNPIWPVGEAKMTTVANINRDQKMVYP